MNCTKSQAIERYCDFPLAKICLFSLYEYWALLIVIAIFLFTLNWGRTTFHLPSLTKYFRGLISPLLLLEYHQTTVTVYRSKARTYQITGCRVIMTTFCHSISIIYHQYILQTIELIDSKLFNERVFSLPTVDRRPVDHLSSLVASTTFSHSTSSYIIFCALIYPSRSLLNMREMKIYCCAPTPHSWCSRALCKFN